MPGGINKKTTIDTNNHQNEGDFAKQRSCRATVVVQTAIDHPDSLHLQLSCSLPVCALESMGGHRRMPTRPKEAGGQVCVLKRSSV